MPHFGLERHKPIHHHNQIQHSYLGVHSPSATQGKLVCHHRSVGRLFSHSHRCLPEVVPTLPTQEPDLSVQENAVQLLHGSSSIYQLAVFLRLQGIQTFLYIGDWPIVAHSCSKAQWDITVTLCLLRNLSLRKNLEKSSLNLTRLI